MLILLVALVVRVAFSLRQPATVESIGRLPDQQEYLSLARNLIREGLLYFFDPRFKQDVFAYRMPGYPLFLAACGGSIRVARLAQCCVDVSTVLAIFLIGRRLSRSDLAALIASVLLAVNPFYIYFSTLLLSETLFAALVAWALYFLIHRRKILFMIFVAASCYVRPTGLMLVLLTPLVEPENRATSTAYRLWDATLNLAVTTLFTLACLFPWALRNHQMLGDWVWTTTNAGITLYDGFNPRATGGSDQRFIEGNALPGSMNEAARSRYFRIQAMDWLRGNPLKLPVLSARKILRGWSPVPLSAEFSRPLYRWISGVYCVPFDLLCIAGLFSRQLSRRSKWLLMMPAILLTIAQVLSVGSIRYRMPAEAPIAVVAAVGAVSWMGRGKFDQRSDANANIEH